MNWVKLALVGLLKSTINQLVREIVQKAAVDLDGEIESTFGDKPEQREAIKAGIVALNARLDTAINERF